MRRGRCQRSKKLERKDLKSEGKTLVNCAMTGLIQYRQTTSHHLWTTWFLGFIIDNVIVYPLPEKDTTQFVLKIKLSRW